MVGYAIYLKQRKQNEEEWMSKLLKSNFFGFCSDHQAKRKSEVNLFCIHCHECLCLHCVSSSSHCLHKVLQIRRYVYHDVVRIDDMQELFDCSKVQQYKLNGAKVLFLKPRPQLKPSGSSNGAPCCKVCERSLTDKNQFCSIACKVSHSSHNSNDYRSSLQFISFSVPEYNATYDDQTDKSDSTDEDYVNKYWLKPKKQLHKRKSIPHRAPLC